MIKVIDSDYFRQGDCWQRRPFIVSAHQLSLSVLHVVKDNARARYKRVILIIYAIAFDKFYCDVLHERLPISNIMNLQ